MPFGSFVIFIFTSIPSISLSTLKKKNLYKILKPLISDWEVNANNLF